MSTSGMTTMAGILALTLAGSIAGISSAAAQAPAFVLQTTDRAMYGTRQVDEGRFADGAERLEKMLAVAGSSRKLRAPALNDLCVAYTMLGELDAAAARCEASVANGRELGIALNNRGVQRVAAGDYEGGVRDFFAALEAGGARLAAEQNLALAQDRIAEQRADEASERAADNDTGSRATDDERAAIVAATVERFARLIEADTLSRVSERLDDRRS